jgi:hypothetical protein
MDKEGEAIRMIKFTQGTFFTLVLLTFTAFIFYITLGLGSLARLVPLRVVIVTFLLILFQLLLDLFSRVTEKNCTSKQTDLLKSQAFRVLGEDKKIPAFWEELRIFLWLLVIPTSIYIFGFLISAPLFVFITLKFWFKESWLISLGIAVGLLCLLYGVFDIFLVTHLEGGIFWKLLS